MTETADKHPAPGLGSERWSHELTARLAFAALLEQRRRRRWGIFFKALFFVYVTVLLLLVLLPTDWEELGGSLQPHTALIAVEGIIADGADASAEHIIESLRDAFDDPNTRAVILHLNSPGGSPVQSGQIYDEILRLRTEHPDTPVYAVASDVCASGAYYVAAAAAEIYADKASLVGSIGVRSGSFGFVEAMDKLGIERRLYTAGENKAFLDPFSPEQPAEVQHMENVIGNVHRQFINAVQQGRGERLSNNPQLFSGLIWTGEQSVELGLVDGLGSVRSVAEDIIGVDNIVDFTQRRDVFEELFSQVQLTLSQTILAYLRG